MTEKLPQIGFEQVRDYVGVDYMDDGIAIYGDFKEIPMSEQGSVRMDMYVIVGCVKGRLEVEINAAQYAIEQNTIIATYPNAVIDNFMLSPNFKGFILCLSSKIISECVSESDLWERAFRFKDNPIIHINEENVSKLRIYEELLQAQIKTKKLLFRKEILNSIVRAVLYELIANIGEYTPSSGSALVRQREVLFKRFIQLLSGCKIKPRSISWYADRLCITPKYLSMICKQVSGKTAFGWINEYVQIDIRRMLKNSDKSIKEVAGILGFPNMSFFGKYCRSHFGMSPTEYRKQLRKQQDGEDGNN